MITFDTVGTCTGVATYTVECYSPADGFAHGSLDVTVTTCVDCHQALRKQLEDCGMTPYSVSMGTSIRPCGERCTFAENSYTTKYPA